MLMQTVCCKSISVTHNAVNLCVLMHMLLIVCTLVNMCWMLYWGFCTLCSGILKIFFFAFSHTQTLHLQSVSACLVSTLSFPLCLYCLWFSSPAQLADKIRACSACPVFPQYHILSLFSSLPLSKAREYVGVCTRMFVYVRAPIPHNWSWYQSLISPEGLTRLLRQPREDLISLHFPDYLPIGIHWVEGETKPWPWKLRLICFSDILASVQWLTLFYHALNWNASISKWLLSILFLRSLTAYFNLS